VPLSFYRNGAAGGHNRTFPDRASYDVSVISVSIWVCWIAAGNNRVAIARGDAGGSNGTWFLGLGATGNHSFGIRLAGTLYTATSGTAPVLGVWYHYAGVYDPADGNTTLYLDGASVGTAATSTAIDATTLAVSVADKTSDSSAHGDILAAHACMWSVKLTADDVAALAYGTPPHIVRPDGRVLCDILEPNSLDVIANIHGTDTGQVANVPASSPRHPGFLRPLPWDGRAEDDEEDAFEALASSFNPLLFSRARALGGRVR